MPGRNRLPYQGQALLAPDRFFTADPGQRSVALELYEVFGVQQKLTGATAQAICDELVDKLARSTRLTRRATDFIGSIIVSTEPCATACWPSAKHQKTWRRASDEP